MRPFLAHRWNRRQKILLLEQLEMFVSAGLSVARGLEIVRDGRSDSVLISLDKAVRDVSSGIALSQVLSRHICLSRSLASIIEYGERTGDLAASLRSAKDLLMKEDELVKRCASAMTYPIVIGILAVVLTVGLIRIVVPSIVPMLVSMHIALPILTKVTIWLSQTIVSSGLYIFSFLLVIILVSVFIYRRYAKVKKYSHKLIFHVPLVGNMIYSYSLSIFIRSLGTLVASGIPIVEAYSEAVHSVFFEPFLDDVGYGTEHIKSGLPPQDIFVNKNMPTFISPLISAGESSGSLGKSLLRVADIIDSDLDHLLKRITSLIEPIMMVVVGGVVGSIALSIMMPIYDMSKVLQHVR